VSARLGEHLRSGDTIARRGGDEFVMIPRDATDRAAAVSVAQRLLEGLAKPFLIRDNRLDVSAGIGIALFPDDATDADELLRNADMALYRAKRDGPDQYRCYSSEMDMELKASHRLETGLREALERGTLELVYQPVFSLQDGSINAAEALTRWPYSDGSYVAPASFIPVAEASGLIIPLGEWTLREACRQARSWTERGWRARVAVNISAVQLRQPDFADLVERTLLVSGLAAAQLELEITEGVFLDPSSSAIAKTLRGVAEIGVRLAIDDFGTGFSNLGYLKNFPFHRIKIDRSFVHDIGKTADAEAITNAIITLTHSLGKSVTAEGVETEGQHAFLRRNRCDEAQGYLLARPKPAHEVQHLFFETSPA
ncbi:MAG: bifunctional diguanylate cyclase/phosphodiesterase, partial [Acetobacteraceae bacterium]|nr:bifunctional diguanylate cyclase/phosphodiesterase [Acetobacteraceae bacterium]